MEGAIFHEDTFDSCGALKNTSMYENQSQHVFPETQFNSKNEELYDNSSSLLELSEKDNTFDLISLDEDSSLFNSEQFQGLLPGYIRLPSISKLNKFKEALSEANAKYLDWIVTELVLSKYKELCSELPTHTATKIRDIITSSTVKSSSIMQNRRGETLTLLGLGEDDFLTMSKKSLLSSEKQDLSNRVMNILKIGIGKLGEERDKFIGTFGGHCLKVIPADTALREERVHQAQLNERLRLRLDQACESLISSSQIMQQLVHVEADAMQQLQKVSYSSLKSKATDLYNHISILKHKLDQISLADVNHTRSMSLEGKSLKTSVDELRERRKKLLKVLEKYERKESGSKRFSEIVAEYAKTKRQLHHKQQTLQVLNEPDTSFL